MANIADPGGYVLSYAVTQPFGATESSSPTGFHTGIDFAMARGTPIPAIHGGYVRFAQLSGDGLSGNVVIVVTDDGDEWWYAHLDRFAVRAGARVSASEVIGYAGSTGRATGPHLHLEWRHPADTPVDPYEEVVMLSNETQDMIRSIVREEIANAGANIERKIDSGFNVTLPIELRRLGRWLKLGEPRDPAGDTRTSPPSRYPDDGNPLG
jgi:murein DD-endopeptidase MepM/ murein hydrolase activator NlpD